MGAMRECAGGDEGVDRVGCSASRLGGGPQPASLLGGGRIDGYDAVDKSALDCRRPCEELSSARRIGRPLGTVADLVNGQHRNDWICLRLYECFDTRFRSWTDKLRQHVRVE